MAELKTKPTDANIEEFLHSIGDERKREDSLVLLEMMQTATGAAPRLWGSNIVGFGDRHYTYASGREGDWFVVGFAPRKQALTLYLMGYLEQYTALLEKLGKHKQGKGCLYINRLQDVNRDVLRELIAASVQEARRQSGDNEGNDLTAKINAAAAEVDTTLPENLANVARRNLMKSEW